MFSTSNPDDVAAYLLSATAIILAGGGLLTWLATQVIIIFAFNSEASERAVRWTAISLLVTGFHFDLLAS